ncbi:hypothetical protein FSP39_002701 [Pinctada imbricata]|uniref:WD repeat-containing protein 97 n=1 Tax=Pinctada imbricata TaxID=66713 RepID=A0AA89BK37_PINIB|nr:hypothetical protein FSP39_002701 [Pinctada imbricata]
MDLVQLMEGHDYEDDEPVSRQLTILLERRKAEERGVHDNGWSDCSDIPRGRQKKNIYVPEEPMECIAYSSHSNQFVGWNKGDDELFLMDTNFEIISQARVPSKINLAKYNHNTSEFITFSSGYFVCWTFRYGARHLIPRKMNKIQYSENNAFAHLVLEETASRQQKCYLSYGKDVVVYNVFEGTELCRRKDLHERLITGLTFFNPLKYLVTGAKDGTIKIWDKEWYLKMVFVGHTGAVDVLSVYPEGPAIVSASKDCTIRVWNLDSCDEMDRVKLEEPVKGLGTELNYHVLHTFSSKAVTLWKIQHLFSIHTSVGQRVVAIKQTSHPFHKIRALIISRDCSIRLITPPTGDVMTTLLLDPAIGILDAAYAIAEDKLFVSLGNGNILKCRTDTNPITVQAEWKCNNMKEACNYLLVYEYVPDFKSDAWAAFKRGLATNTIGQGQSQQNEKTILLGGRRDGYICVFDWETGDIQYKIDAHGVKGVLSMKANSKQDQLISAGKDNIIKVWRLYPFAEESLAPLMSFYCAHTPVHMTMLKTNLCVAFQDHTSATYNIVIYNLKDRMFGGPGNEGQNSLEIHSNRYDHKPDDDHKDTITGLTSCQRMKLYASASLDGTVRIWDETNTLIRLLKLKTMPYSIGFCSEKGDILVGINHHLYCIPHTAYLPKSYMFKMVSMKFVNPKPETPLKLDEKRVSKLSKKEFTRLKKSHSSFKYNNFEDILTKEEEEEVMREQRIKEAAFKLLTAREEELKLIRDHQIVAETTKVREKKKSKVKEVKIESEAFINYFKMYYSKPRPKVQYLGQIHYEEEPWKPEREPTGFFPPVQKAAKLEERPESAPLQPAYNSATTSGMVPNSVLVKILFPPPPPKEDKKDAWRPPSLSHDQMEEIERERTPEDEEVGEEVTVEVDTQDRTFYVDDWADDEKSAAPSPIQSEGYKTPPKKEVTFSTKKTVHVIGETPPPKTPTPPPSSRQTSSLLSKFNEMMSKPQEEEKEKDDDESTVTMTPRSPIESDREKSILSDKPPSPAKPKTPPPPPSPKKEVKPLKPLVKYTKPPEPPKEPAPVAPPPKPRPVLPTAPPPREPTPPRPETPLPEYITQFKGAEWFEKFFPNASENTLPKPWSPDGFITMLSRLLRIAEYVYKIAVTDAIAMLYTQEDISDGTVHSIAKTLIAVLNHPKDPPTCLVEEQKNFIMSALRAMSKFSSRDKEFVTELLVQFLDGDKEVRTTVLDILTGGGMQDPQKFFPKELDTWDIWNVNEEDRKGDLRKMCQQWLDRHYRKDEERSKHPWKMNRGGGKNRMTPPPSKSILKRPSIGGDQTIMEDQETVTTLPDMEERATQRNITVTFDKPPDPALIESATYIDAINYFCDMMMEKALDSMKKGGRKPAGSQENVVQAKNTVLVLPKLPHKPALVRLGETHTSTCRPHRETNLHVDYRQLATTTRGNQPLPGQLTGFTPSINLPMKTLYVNPFPSALDYLTPVYQEPILITLKSSQKYFIPSQSVVAMPEDTQPTVAPAH